MKKTISADKFDGIISLINEKFKDVFEKLERIENQTAKTNGTVADLVSWKSFSKGATSILSLVILPILLYLVYIHLVK